MLENGNPGLLPPGGEHDAKTQTEAALSQCIGGTSVLKASYIVTSFLPAPSHCTGFGASGSGRHGRIGGVSATSKTPYIVRGFVRVRLFVMARPASGWRK